MKSMGYGDNVEYPFPLKSPTFHNELKNLLSQCRIPPPFFWTFWKGLKPDDDVKPEG